MSFSLWAAALFVLVACDTGDGTTPEAVCEEPSAVDPEEAMELYVEAWGEEDPSERACMIQRSLAADAVLMATDPPISGRSAVAQELDERITFLLGEATGRDAEGAVLSRHDEARLPWVLADRAGTVIESGEDWLEFNEDGLLSRIHILAGTGVGAPLPEALLAWQRAWNTRDEASRTDELRNAATDDVRFTDILTEVRGRDALGVEIGRQQDEINAELRLDDGIEVFASEGDELALIRVRAQVVVPEGGAIHVVDYIRLRDGRIERLSGFPNPAP